MVFLVKSVAPSETASDLIVPKYWMSSFFDVIVIDAFPRRVMWCSRTANDDVPSLDLQM